MVDVSIAPCASYEEGDVRPALEAVLAPLGGLDWVRAGMKIVVKANLVSMMKPDRAATTHPALLCELVQRLRARGAEVVVGDSPGGLYNSVALNRVYAATGMREVEAAGAVLNFDFSTVETDFPEAKVARRFTYTGYLDRADAIIDFCKLKTHGMMGMSAAVKNLFGVIPGTFKPEYHFRYPNHRQFAEMLVDLNRYFEPKVRLCLCDAVVGMEGNGPTQGTPRKIGAILASQKTYPLDLVCAHLIGLGVADVPTLEVSRDAGLIPDTVDGLEVAGSLNEFIVSDYENIHVHRSLQFEGKGKLLSSFIRRALQAKPVPDRSLCVGCRECEKICPARAIVMKDQIPQIERAACITCFCCQEFCPKGAMKVHRPLVARILNRSGKTG